MSTDAGKRRAFSLIEIGMGLILIALMIIPVIGVLRSSVKGTAQSIHLTKAFQVARMVVDTAEAFSYTDLTDDALKTAVDALELPDGVEKPQLEKVKTVAADGTPGAPPVDVKVVTVRVGWQKAEGAQDKSEVVLHGLVLNAR